MRTKIAVKPMIIELACVCHGLGESRHDPRKCGECEDCSLEPHGSDYLICCRCLFLIDRKTGVKKWTS